MPDTPGACGDQRFGQPGPGVFTGTSRPRTMTHEQAFRRRAAGFAGADLLQRPPAHHLAVRQPNLSAGPAAAEGVSAGRLVDHPDVAGKDPAAVQSSAGEGV